MRQQRLGATGLLFDPLMAALRERAIAGKMVIALRLGRIDELLARRVRPVERNIICCHCFNFTGLQWRRASGWSVRQIGGFRRRNQRPISTPAGNKGGSCPRQLSTSFRRAGSAANIANQGLAGARFDAREVWP